MIELIHDELISLIILYMSINELHIMKQLNYKFKNLIHDMILIEKFYKKLLIRRCHIYGNKYFVSLIGKNINNLLYFNSLRSGYNIFDIAVYCGNDELLLLKKEFPNIKHTRITIDSVVKNGHTDTLKLLIKKFPDIYPTYFTIDYAVSNGYNDILMLLMNAFPGIEGTCHEFDGAAKNEHNDTLMLLKKLFPCLGDHFMRFQK